MSYTPAILFDFVSTSANNGKIVSTLTDGSPIVAPGRNVYYKIVGPAGLAVYTPDFNTPDGNMNTVTPTATMPLVTVPMDSLGNWLEGSYTITFYVENAAVPGVYEQVVCTFTLDVKKQGASCVIEGKIEVDVNCHCGLMHVEETTNYQGSTIISHLLELVPPTLPGQPSPSVLSTAGYTYDTTIQYSNVTWTFNISTVYENYYCEEVVTVREDLLATYSEKIVCDRNPCALTKCLVDKLNEIISLASSLGGFNSLPKSVWNQYVALQIYWMEYQLYVTCGDWESADGIFDIIKRLLNCDCGCATGNASQPVLIIADCGPTSVTSIIAASPQVTVANPSPGVFAIGLTSSFIQAATRDVDGTSPVVVTFDVPNNKWVVSLDPAFVAAATAGGLTNITTGTPTYLTITTPGTGIRQIDFDPTPIYNNIGFTSWVEYTNVQASTYAGTIDFDNTPYNLRTQRNETFLKQIKFDGCFKYNAYNPNTPICLLLPGNLTLPGTTHTGMSIPCFNDSGEVVGTLRLFSAGASSNIVFTHNNKYVKNSVVNVNGVFNLD